MSSNTNTAIIADATSASPSTSTATASTASTSSLDILIHPLVILSIADHFTRTVHQYNQNLVLGLLFGHQDGRTVSVLETVEMAYKFNNTNSNNTIITAESLLIQSEELERDMELFTASYPDYECLGWYRSGITIEQSLDYSLHKQFSKYNERPLFLLMDPGTAANTNTGSSSSNSELKDLPFTLYEESIHVIGDRTVSEFNPSKYIITADEAERITVIHCAKLIQSNNSNESSIVSHYNSLIKSIESLTARIELIQRYLIDSNNGIIEPDQSVLREIKALCQRLPTMKSSEFRAEFYNEYNDALLTSYLASITQATTAMAECTDRFITATPIQQQQQGGRRGSGSAAGIGMLGDEDFQFNQLPDRGRSGKAFGGIMSMMGM